MEVCDWSKEYDALSQLIDLEAEWKNNKMQTNSMKNCGLFLFVYKKPKKVKIVTITDKPHQPLSLVLCFSP